MTEADIEIILKRAKEAHPKARPLIISDNGPQFIARDFKEFIRISGGPGPGSRRNQLSYPRPSGRYPANLTSRTALLMKIREAPGSALLGVRVVHKRRTGTRLG